MDFGAILARFVPNVNHFVDNFFQKNLTEWTDFIYTKMLDRYAHPDQSDALAAANKLKAITTKLPPPDAESIEK